MKLSKNKKLKNKLKKRFNEAGLPDNHRVVWCEKKDGNNFDEDTTVKLHETLEAIGYDSIPSEWNGGYVLHYSKIGSTKQFYKDPWSIYDPKPIIDPNSPFFNLSKEDMALLAYGIEIGGYSKPLFPSGLKQFAEGVKDKQGDWQDIQKMFNELPASKQAMYIEGVYFQKKSTNEIDALESQKTFTVNTQPDLEIAGYDPVIQKRIAALRTDIAREMDAERKVTLQMRLDALVSENEPSFTLVKDFDVLNKLKQRYGFNQAPLNELVLSLNSERSHVVHILHTLKERGWVNLALTENASAGLVSLTSKGYKVAGDNTPTLKDIHTTLVSRYSATQLRRFCNLNPNFKPLTLQFSGSEGLIDIADKIIEYSDKNSLLNNLVSELPQYI